MTTTNTTISITTAAAITSYYIVKFIEKTEYTAIVIIRAGDPTQEIIWRSVNPIPNPRLEPSPGFFPGFGGCFGVGDDTE